MTENHGATKSGYNRLLLFVAGALPNLAEGHKNPKHL